MTYNPGTPNASDLPSDCQDEFLSNFSLLNSIFGFDHIPFGNRIQNATRDNPCQITSIAHGRTTGDQVTVNNLLDTSTNEYGNYNEWSINGNTYAVTVIDVDTFTIPVNTSSFNPYVENSGDFTIFSLISGLPVPYGYHKKVSLANVLPQGPFRISPITTIFTKLANVTKIVQSTGLPELVDPLLFPTTQKVDISQLTFQNGSAPSNEFALIQSSFSEKTYFEIVTPKPKNYQGFSFGFTTGFNLKVNFGYVFSKAAAAVTYDLPVHYSSVHYTIVATNRTAVGATADPRITAVTLNDFSIQSPGSTANQFNYFLSIGR